MNEWLFGKNLDELTVITARAGMPKFTARQIADWLYKKHAGSVEEMTNLSLANRRKLASEYTVGKIPPAEVQSSVDGTKKYLYPTLSHHAVEAAYIPDRDRATLCVSSQAGCGRGCRFCMTARQGFQHNLSAGEILNQMESLPERDRLTNLVYMGMGEPLDNPDNVIKSLGILTAEWGYGWSPSRITLSTIGIVPGLERFLKETRVHLAVSLHNPFPEERMQMMPGEKTNPIESVLKTIERHDFSGQRRVSYEYIMFRGINDSDRHLRELVRMGSRMKVRFNLIRFHSIPDAPYEGSDLKRMEKFRDELSRKGIVATIRASRGEDIFAACGLLSTKSRSDL